MLRRPATLWFTSLLLLLGHGARGQVSGASELTPQMHFFKADNGEQVKAQKGLLWVPENRLKPDSRSIPIHFIRFPSTAGQPDSPIVFLPAGPDSSGIEVARGSNFSVFMALRAVSDVIVFDQRGTGSEAMSCEDSIQLPVDRPGSYAAVVAVLVKKSMQCKALYESRGYDLSGYTTVESANDVEDLRRALGIERLSLFGYSYGSHYALTILKLFDDNIDRVIVASVEGPDHTFKLPKSFDDHLDDLSLLLQTNPKFGDSISDLRETLRIVLQRLEEKPVVVSITDDKTGKKVSLPIGKFDVQLLIMASLGREKNLAPLPAMLHRLGQGDFLSLAKRLYQIKSRGLRLSAMGIMMDGASGASEARLEQIRLEAETSPLGRVMNFPFPELGNAWGAPDLGPEFRAPVQSNRPVLIISGTMDARTPVRNGEELARGLPNSQHIIVTGAGHASSYLTSSPEIVDVMLGFLKGQSVPSLHLRGPELVFDEIQY